MLARRFALCPLMLFLALVGACVAPSAEPTQPPATATTLQIETTTLTSPPEGAAGPFWWNDAVFYEIFVRSFYDSDGDGVGDLNGIIEKLDYLNEGDPATTDDLGITGIWLMPITQSPSYHGYDVVDYFTVDDEYGTDEDLRRLMEEAHKRDIRVIVDLVLNHTSSQHPWFVSARGDVNSPYRDFYIWSEESPGYRSPWGGPVWHRCSTGYYYGIFWEGMPDLNYDNPAVTAEMEKVIRFWLENVGADGFRLDAVKHLIEEGRVQENTPATHEWLRGLYTFYKRINPDVVTVGEAWSSTTEVVNYIGDQLDLAFEFDTAQAMLRSARFEDQDYILRAHRLITESYPPDQFATFLTNHDQKRAMSELGEDVNRAKMAASLLLTGPGVPFLYYGEEIGHVGGKPDENIRTPMQWSDEGNAGFTAAPTAWRAPQSNYREVNVAAQTDDPDSLLSHYRQLIHARNDHAALRVGDWREVEVEDRRIYAFLRHSDDETLLVLINLGSEPITDYTLSLAEGPLSEGSASEIFAGVPVSASTVNANGGFDGYAPLAEVEAYSTYIIRLE
jgi:alpha-amylase